MNELISMPFGTSGPLHPSTVWNSRPSVSLVPVTLGWR